MSKLELGSGENPMPGYDYYADVYPAEKVTHVLDFNKDGLNAFENNSLDEILAIHFLEHLPQDKQDFFFQECRRKLRPGGKLIVHVPNLETVFRAYELWKNDSKTDYLLDALQIMLFGMHTKDVYSMHKIAYNWQILEERFGKNGFSSIRNLTGISRDRHTEGWQWVVDQVRNNGSVAPDFSLIVEGVK